LVDLGYRICEGLNAGKTALQEASVAFVDPAFNFSINGARAVVSHAQDSLR
jgi:hypothetical protein